MFKNLALITSVAALGAYVWLLGSVFQPRVCIDSRHIISLDILGAPLANGKASTPVDLAAESVFQVLGRGMCETTETISPHLAASIAEFNSDFSDLERFATWIGRPLQTWNIQVRVGAAHTAWDPKLMTWFISTADFEGPGPRRLGLVSAWLQSMGQRVGQVTATRFLLAHFITSRIWNQSRKELLPEHHLFVPHSELASHARTLQMLTEVSDKLWVLSRSHFYRAVVDTAVRATPDELAIPTDSHQLAFQIRKTFSAVIGQVEDRSLQQQVLYLGLSAVEHWLESIETLPVVIHFEALPSGSWTSDISETVTDKMRFIVMKSVRIDEVQPILGTFHNRIVVESETALAIHQVLSLRNLARKVLLVPGNLTDEVRSQYDTYFRLGPVAFAGNTKDFGFVELFVPALELAVKKGISPDYHFIAGGDFQVTAASSDLSKRGLAQLVGYQAPKPLDSPGLYRFDSALTPIEFYRTLNVHN